MLGLHLALATDEFDEFGGDFLGLVQHFDDGVGGGTHRARRNNNLSQQRGQFISSHEVIVMESSPRLCEDAECPPSHARAFEAPKATNPGWYVVYTCTDMCWLKRMHGPFKEKPTFD